MRNLQGKTALITGATGKLTKYIVARLAREGVDLALHFHQNQAQAERLRQTSEADGVRCKIYSADLTEQDAATNLVSRVLKDFNGIDILVNSACEFVVKTLPDTDDALLEKIISLNITVPFKLSRALTKNFSSRGCAIINLADIWGLRPKSSFIAYSVAKAGLIALTKGLAEEFAPNITVNAIAPGIIDFPDDAEDSKRQKVLSKIPAARFGEPEEIAETVIHIISNRYMTGQVIVVDGGRSLF